MTEKEVHDYCRGERILGEYASTCNEQIELFELSGYNFFSGPDFEMAHVRINELVWYGAAEVHIESKDWFRHGHHTDPSYNHVVLHIVLRSNAIIIDNNGRRIPEIQLEASEIASIRTKQTKDCNSQVSNLPRVVDIHSYAEKRLQRKANLLLCQLPEALSWKQVWYRSICAGLGIHVHRENLLQFTDRFPIHTLEKYAANLEQVYAVVFGLAGFIDRLPMSFQRKNAERIFERFCSSHPHRPMCPHQWKRSGTRPPYHIFPVLSKLTWLLHQGFFRRHESIEHLSLEGVLHLLKRAGAHLNMPEGFQFRFTDQFCQNLVINSICPYLYCRGSYFAKKSLISKSLEWLEKLPFERNRITNDYERSFSRKSALISQGILEWRRNNS